MTLDSLPQPPEGLLIQAAQKESGRSIRSVAALAGMSEARWRQIVKGSMHVQGTLVPVAAPAQTLARMAQAVDVTGDQLRSVGRHDAADMLGKLDELVDPETALAQPSTAPTRPAQVNGEIELIYASQTMTAQQKLDAIRMVLQLRAEIEAEGRPAGPARPATVHAKAFIPQPTIAAQPAEPEES